MRFHIKKPTICGGFLIIIMLACTLFSYGYGLEVSQGDIFWWELGNSKSTTSYIKITYKEIKNNTVWIDYEEYDLVGELTAIITNKSAGFMWVDPEIFQEWENKNYEKQNITFLGTEFQCIIREWVYDEETTLDYYDLESGILVKSESNFGNFKTLISLTDINLQDYMEEHNKKIDVFPIAGLLATSGIVSVLTIRKIKRKRMQK
ncbi:MAG: hypothetical protein ACTSWC_10530 [Promethearchaeota archaeon]